MEKPFMYFVGPLCWDRRLATGAGGQMLQNKEGQTPFVFLLDVFGNLRLGGGTETTATLCWGFWSHCVLSFVLKQHNVTSILESKSPSRQVKTSNHQDGSFSLIRIRKAESVWTCVLQGCCAFWDGILQTFYYCNQSAFCADLWPLDLWAFSDHSL